MDLIEGRLSTPAAHERSGRPGPGDALTLSCCSGGMESTVAALIAVVGTLLGAAVTHMFQARKSAQDRQAARGERLWQERLAAYSSFAEALTDFRRVQNDRWHLEQEDSTSEAFIRMRDESYKDRAKVTAAMFRLRLLSSDERLNDLAARALTEAEDIPNAINEADRAARGQAARNLLREFVETASQQIVQFGENG
ncbi:hypothetical protein ACIBEJ_47635 [Nonomuraea sp. NPDC050790]|uniref:hypothetical protein n=1 Tax=Nonomuraea sp. NPDC050790 TaxID=3364371 RepID=UPI0037A68673